MPDACRTCGWRPCSCTCILLSSADAAGSLAACGPILCLHSAVLARKHAAPSAVVVLLRELRGKVRHGIVCGPDARNIAIN
eukprot:5599218-Alexandrium_andersonii.AAC.1